jgi:hypothetical protein
MPSAALALFGIDAGFPYLHEKSSKAFSGPYEKAAESKENQQLNGAVTGQTSPQSEMRAMQSARLDTSDYGRRRYSNHPQLQRPAPGAALRLPNYCGQCKADSA